jgi:hypothetical protein
MARVSGSAVWLLLLDRVESLLGRFGITNFVSGRAEHRFRELQVRRIVLYHENVNGYPSTLGVDSIILSKGRIPDGFLWTPSPNQRRNSGDRRADDMSTVLGGQRETFWFGARFVERLVLNCE